MKKIMIWVILSSIIILNLISSILAIPGIPHQFYGEVIINGAPSPDNNIVTATINGENYVTITKNGRYGLSPNIFYIEDMKNDKAGKIIYFYVGGKPVKSYVFENDGFTRLNLEVNTTCGDGYCLGDETCNSCLIDCGVCTEAPIIKIHSPENKTYYTNKIELKVSSDQDIWFWMYSINRSEPVGFKPNITLTLNNGTYLLQVIGINRNVGISEVNFNIILPVCGDSICDEKESCSECPQDCGQCTSQNSKRSSGGGGGGSYNANKNISVELVNENLQKYGEEVNSDLKPIGSDERKNEIKNESGINKITGYFINFAKKREITDLILIAASILIVIIAILYLIKGKR